MMISEPFPVLHHLWTPSCLACLPVFLGITPLTSGVLGGGILGFLKLPDALLSYVLSLLGFPSLNNIF